MRLHGLGLVVGSSPSQTSTEHRHTTTSRLHDRRTRVLVSAHDVSNVEVHMSSNITILVVVVLMQVVGRLKLARVVQ